MLLAVTPPSRVVAGTLCCAVAATAVAAGSTVEEPRRSYRLPRGEAAATLAQFATECGRPILFMMDAVRGEQTNTLSGTYTPREALDRLLAGTALVAVHDPKSGGFIVNRRAAPSKPERAEAEKARGPPKRKAIQPPKTPRTAQPNLKESPPVKKLPFFAFVAGWLAASISPAAAPVSSPVANPADAPPLILSPFEVQTQRDVGYVAAASLAGGRIATDLRDIPAAVSVLTAEFLTDIGANTVQEAASWLPGTVDRYSQTNIMGEDRSHDFRFDMRGLSVLSSDGMLRPSRNYVGMPVNFDSFSVERLEQPRGPNAIVTGEATAMGTLNSYSKRASFVNRTTVRVQAGEWQRYRGEFDLNRRVHRAVGVRLAGVYAHDGGYVQGQGSERRGVFGTVTARLWRGAELRADFEHFRSDQSYAYRPLENYLFWDGATTVSAPLSANPSATSGLQRITTSNWVYHPATGAFNSRNLAQTTGTNMMLQPGLYNGLPATKTTIAGNLGFTVPNFRYALSPSGLNSRTQHTLGEIALTQQLGDRWFLEVQATKVRKSQPLIPMNEFNQLRVDVNRNFVDAAGVTRANPQFGKVYAEAAATAESAWDIISVLRGSAARIQPLGRLGELRLMAAGEIETYDRDRLAPRFIRPANVPGVTDLANNDLRLFVRRYVGEEGAAYSLPADGRWAVVSGSNFKNTSDATSFSYAATGKLLDGRVHPMAGVRHTSVKSYERLARYNSANELAGWAPSLRTIDFRDTSTNYGVVVWPFKTHVGLVFNHGETFSRPVPDRMIVITKDPVAAFNDAVGLPPQSSTEDSAGLKLELLGGKLVGNVTRYKGSISGQRPSTSTQRGWVNAIWNLVYPAQTGRAWTNLENIYWRDVGFLEYEGTEAELTLNLGRFRLYASAAWPEATRGANLLLLQKYVETFAPEWETYARARPVGDANRTIVETNLANLRSNIAFNSAPGEQQQRVLSHKYSAFGTYRFTQGRLRGFSAGLGFQLEGERLVATDPAGRPVMRPGSTLLNGMLAYQTKIRGLDTRWQLNLENLLDDRFVRYATFGNLTNTAASGFAPGYYPLQYSVNPPRTFRFSVSTTF